MDVHHIRTTNPTESEHDMSSTNTTVAIKDNEQHLVTETQYGMRFPDGTINWEHGFMTGRGQRVHWGQLTKSEYTQDGNNWDAHLKSMAEAAHIDPAKYARQHQLVKRTIVVAVTEAEDVKPPRPKSDDLTPSLNAPWS
jgi:hypothetical protein